MEKKKYQVFPVEIKGVDKESATLEAIFSSQKEDRHGDVVMQDGWDLKNFNKNPVILNSHNYNDASEVIGKASGLKIEKKTLTGKIKFAVAENPKAKVIFDLYAGGFLNAFSVGFIAKEFDEKDPYKITKSELLEVSAVSVPANAYALAKQKGIDVDLLGEEEIAKGVGSDEGLDNPEPEEEPKTEEKILKKEIEEGILCMYCNKNITEEAKQFSLKIRENVFELVCEDCYKEKSEPNEEPEEEEELEEKHVDSIQSNRVRRKKSLLKAINSITYRKRLALKEASDIINSILAEQKDHKLNTETLAKIRKRKVNQAIRKMIEAK